MPDAERITTLLSSRWERSFGGWMERVRSEIDDKTGVYLTSYTVPVLVRLMPTPQIDQEYTPLWYQGHGPAALTIEEVAHRARVSIVRHLQGDQFVVQLWEQEDQNTLALMGYLDVTRHGVRMVAL